MTLPVAVILAAGLGRRLSSLTHDRPKALVEVAGRTLLGRSLEALAGASFPEAVVVTGHRAELVDDFVARREWGLEVRCRFNPQFDAANNIVSFLTAADEMSHGLCLLNSDIVFDARILADVAAASRGSWLVVDTDEPLGAEEMKVELDGDGSVSRISKKLSPATSVGEYIGIARFDAAGAAEVIAAARRLVDEGGGDLYYEDAIDAVASRLVIRPLPVARRAWTEIDDLADYERATAIAKELDGKR